jgi:inosine/xanthosine triphosphatase
MTVIVIASKNPVKIRAIQQGFERMFPGELIEYQAVTVPSGVSEQPGSNMEALRGACNRVENAQKEYPDADYWAGIEGGVEELEEELTAFAWVIIRSKERLGKSRTGTFILPQAVSEHVRRGMELGAADDIIFGEFNSKQKNGAVGLLTRNAIDRTSFYTEAVILALIPFKNPHLY